MNIEQAQALAMICHYAKEYLKDNKTMSQSVDIAKGIIEKELKRLEELEKAFETLSKEEEKVMKELSKEIEKNRALEIIKKYPSCSLQRYIGFNNIVENGYELTQEHLFNWDMPCSVDEFKIVIKGLL